MIFSLSTYRELMQEAKRVGYTFINFDMVNDVPDAHKLLLRHDIDADLSAALEMAELECDLGISSTYFLMLRSPLYNLMGRRNSMIVKEILSLGHSIGLHYDQGFDSQRGWSYQQTSLAVDHEANWLEHQFESRVAAVSFHQPGPAILQGEITTGNRINTYDRKALACFSYYSDSNRQFSLAKLADGAVSKALSVCAPENMQLLIHPIWWVYDDLSTGAVWNRAIQSNLNMMQEQLLETERAYGAARHFNVIELPGQT